SVRRTRRAATGAGAVLQRDRAAIGRSGAAYSHADRWLLLRHPLGGRLCEEVHLNLAYRWFCGLGLDGEVPITRPSRRTGTAASATAICCAGCLRPCCGAASPKAWSAAKALSWTPV